MNVSEAVVARRSIRAFLDKPVSLELIRDVLTKAARSPSGGNLQPWKIYVPTPEAHERFKVSIMEKLQANPMGEETEYDIYPKGLGEPYKTIRYRLGDAMYELIGIPREDKPARLMWLANNYQFFGAPASFFCFIERNMGRAQWSDLGMYLQTAMLLFQEAGIDTCAQEAWSRWPKTVAEFVGAPDDQMLFCGMAVGYRDPDQPVNDLVAEREPFENFATIVE